MEAAQIVDCVSNYCSSFMTKLGNEKTTDHIQSDTQDIAIKALVEIKNELANYDATESASGFLEKQLRDFTRSDLSDKEIEQKIFDSLLQNLKDSVENTPHPDRKKTVKAMDAYELKEANKMLDGLFPHGPKNALSKIATEKYQQSEQYQKSKENLKNEQSVPLEVNLKQGASTEEDRATPDKEGLTRLKFKENTAKIRGNKSVPGELKPSVDNTGNYSGRADVTSFMNAADELQRKDSKYKMTEPEFSRIVSVAITNKARQDRNLTNNMLRYYIQNGEDELADKERDKVVNLEACTYLSNQTVGPIVERLLYEQKAEPDASKRLSFDNFRTAVKNELEASRIYQDPDPEKKNTTFTREEFRDIFYTHTYDPRSKETVYYWSPHEDTAEFNKLVTAYEDGSWKPGETREYNPPKINQASTNYLNKRIDDWSSSDDMKKCYELVVFGTPIPKAQEEEEEEEFHEPPPVQAQIPATTSSSRTQESEPTAPVRKGMRKTIKGWFKWSNPSGANPSSVDDVVGFIPKSVMPPPPPHSQPDAANPNDAPRRRNPPPPNSP